MKLFFFILLTSFSASAQIPGFFQRCTNTPGSIDCYNMNITDLPSDIFIHFDIEHLNLQHNVISQITTNTFYGASQVTTLDLSYNTIHFIGDNAFLPFGKLDYLNLAGNQISSLPTHFLEGLRKLRILDLTQNYIKLLPGAIFEPTPLLHELKLSLNPIEDIASETFMHLRKLNRLLLDHTNIRKLHEDIFEHSKRIHTLNLAHNLFTKVPHLKLHNLRALDLSFNHIHEIQPNAFEKCPKITNLYINNNHGLTAIRAEAFSKLHLLRQLHCSYNNDLTVIDPNAFYTHGNITPRALEQLHLRGNKLQTLPEELVDWNKLFYLDLRGNPWRCDCNLVWLQKLKLKQSFQDQMICERPRRLSGQSLGSLSSEKMVCGIYIRWNVVTILLGVLVASVSLTLGFLLRNRFIRKRRSSARYARISPLPDRTDIDIEMEDKTEL